jgi:autotransporter-associated beta strand protein
MKTVRNFCWMAVPLVSAVITGAPALAQPAPGVLVTSFESEADLFTPMDPSIAGTAAVALSYSEGVTQGFASMEVVPTGYAWSWLTKNFDATTYQQWYDHNKLSIDLTRVTTAAGNFELVAAMNGPQGWNQQQLVNWAWQNPGITNTQTLVWDYTAIRDAAPAPGSGVEADYWQLNLMPRTNPDYAPQFGYIDNIRFIDPVVPPEPSELLWAANGFTPGGSGTWDAEAFTWLDGQTATTWSQYGRAVLGGTGGPVSVSGTIPLQSGIRFETNGYTVEGGSLDLVANAAAYNTINVGPAATATINAMLTGSAGFTKTGTGTLTLAGVNTVTGSATVAAGTLVAVSDAALAAVSVVVPTGGRLEAPAGVTLNAVEVRLAGGALAVPTIFVAQATPAQPVVMNSFETVADLYDPTVSITNVMQSTTTGVTEGLASMQTTLINGNSYAWSFKSDYGPFYEAWKAHKQIALDVTRVTAPEGAGNMVMNVALNGEMGWNQKNSFVNYVWQSADTTTTETYYWDTSAIAAAAPEASSWFQISLGAAVGSNGGVPYAPQTVYFDNLRLVDPVVPPASGIGSLVIESGSIAGSPDLTVANGGVLTLPSASRFAFGVTSLAINTAADQPAGGGLVDLGAGQISVATGGVSPDDLRASIIAGRNGGAWNGTAGITSAAAATSGGTRAVGYVVNANGSAAVSFAASGDVDLSGAVNVFDLVSINSAGKYGKGTAAIWQQGDFNYDGVTNVFDLVSVNTAGSYGQGNYFPAAASALGGTGSVAAVPEPAALGIVTAGLGLAAAIRLRRRRARPGKNHA